MTADGGYEPHFDRLGPERRVLAFVTDEEHIGKGPRNTRDFLVDEITNDPFSDQVKTAKKVDNALNRLVDDGLLKRREDGSYAVTPAGRVELAH